MSDKRMVHLPGRLLSFLTVTSLQFSATACPASAEGIWTEPALASDPSARSYMTMGSFGGDQVLQFDRYDASNCNRETGLATGSYGGVEDL